MSETRKPKSEVEGLLTKLCDEELKQISILLTNAEDKKNQIIKMYGKDFATDVDNFIRNINYKIDALHIKHEYCEYVESIVAKIAKKCKLKLNGDMTSDGIHYYIPMISQNCNKIIFKFKYNDPVLLKKSNNYDKTKEEEKFFFAFAIDGQYSITDWPFTVSLAHYHSELRPEGEFDDVVKVRDKYPDVDPIEIADMLYVQYITRDVLKESKLFSE